MRVRRSGLVAVALMLMLPLSVAHAQSDQDKAMARSLWSQASEALAGGRFEETIDLASRAEALVHAPTHLVLIARAQVKLGRLVAAKETYLKIGREDLAATASGAFKRARQEAMDELAVIEPRIASIKVVIEGAAGRKVSVKIDDQPVADVLVGVHRPIDPGKHAVVAQAPSVSPIQQSVSLGDGEKKEITLVIPAGPLPAGTPAHSNDGLGASGGLQDPAVPPDQAEGGGMSGLRIAGIGVTGLGVAGLGVGVAFYLVGIGTQGDGDDAFSACNAAGCSLAEQAKIEDLDDDAALQKTIGVIAGGAGIALIGGGIMMIMLGKNASKPQAPRSAWVAPYLAPDGDGFGIHGGF